jgi:hypothetical protein
MKTQLYTGQRNMRVADSSTVHSDIFEKSDGNYPSIQSKLRNKSELKPNYSSQQKLSG